MPYLTTLSTFRDEVRKLSISQASPKEILALCDRLRDIDLAPLGVALDDQEGTFRSLNSLDHSFRQLTSIIICTNGKQMGKPSSSS